MSCPKSDLAPYVIIFIVPLLSDTTELPIKRKINSSKITSAQHDIKATINLPMKPQFTDKAATQITNVKGKEYLAP